MNALIIADVVEHLSPLFLAFLVVVIVKMSSKTIAAVNCAAGGGDDQHSAMIFMQESRDRVSLFFCQGVGAIVGGDILFLGGG